MTVAAFIDTLAIAVGFVAGLYFCLGSTELTAAEIRRLGGAYWDRNPHLTAFFVSLKGDYLCGAIALMLAFLLQLIALLPGQLMSSPMFATTEIGIFVAAACAALLWLLLRVGRRYTVRKVSAEIAAADRAGEGGL